MDSVFRWMAQHGRQLNNIIGMAENDGEILKSAFS
jgi:hypothetical protein